MPLGNNIGDKEHESLRNNHTDGHRICGGVWANESYDIGSDPAGRISNVVGSATDSLGSSGIQSVDAAKTELRDLEESRNREATRLIQMVNDNALVPHDSEMGRRIIRRGCEVSRSLIRDDKRMVGLMRFIDENDPSAPPVTVTLTTSEDDFFTVVASTKTRTADELEDTFADREWDLDTLC